MVDLSNTDVKFYGWDMLRYYWYVWQNQYNDYPWQVYVAWLVVVCSVFTLFVLGFKFLRAYRRTKRYNSNVNKLKEKYYDKLLFILSHSPMTTEDILGVLGEDIQNDISHPQQFIPIITQIRMECKQSYFSNMMSVCSILNITEYCENGLLKNKNVFNILQFICINQLVIMEGRLANYLNHKDPDIRTMARLCYMFCAYNTPYKYLVQELESPSEMKMMFMHFIFVWMKENGKDLPDFNKYTTLIENKKSLEFLNNERKLLC